MPILYVKTGQSRRGEKNPPVYARKQQNLRPKNGLEKSSARQVQKNFIKTQNSPKKSGKSRKNTKKRHFSTKNDLFKRKKPKKG